MTTPTQPMPGTEVRVEITRFVAAVEQALDDLPRDDAAELTDGLEADLIEAWAAEGIRPGERFGSPASYAAELRAAAGLPPRKRRGMNGPAAIRLQWQRDRERLVERLRDRPWWPQAVEHGQELRPAWWALRGALLVGLVFYVVIAFFGLPLFGLVALVFVPAAIWGAVVSMRAGAAGSAASPRARQVLAVANVLAIALVAVGALAFVSGSGSHSSEGDYVDEGLDGPAGLTSAGETVTNVFAYDAEGKPLTRIRLYDQAGRPLTIDESAREGWDDNSGEHWVSRPDVGQGPEEWNLFPLQRIADPDDVLNRVGGTDPEGPAVGSDGSVHTVAPPTAVPPPFEQLPALPSPSPGAAPATGSGGS